MKKMLVILFLLNTFISFGQSCEQRLNDVIKGFNNFKSCSQRAEMNKLLAKASTVIDECPLYYAEHQTEYLKAKKYVEDTYKKLGCISSGNGQTNPSSNTSNNSDNTKNLPVFEDKYNFEEVGDVVKDGAVKITQKSLADLQSTYQKEQELLKILRGNEKKYPKAIEFYNEFLRAKKQQKRIGHIGLGIMGAGVIAVGAGILPLLSESNNGEMNNGLLYGGISAAIIGAGMTIFTIAPSKKSKGLLEKARSFVAISTTKNGLGVALNF